MDKYPIKISWGDEVNGLRMGIGMEKNRYNYDERQVVLEIFISNVSDKRIRIVESHILVDYDIELSREDNQLVPGFEKRLARGNQCFFAAGNRGNDQSFEKNLGRSGLGEIFPGQRRFLT